MKCPKCNAESGDDWKQCRSACPMPISPHYNVATVAKYAPKGGSEMTDDWIPHTGDTCPVPDDTVVEIKLAGSNSIGIDPASTWYWGQDIDSANIIAYRVVSQDSEPFAPDTKEDLKVEIHRLATENDKLHAITANSNLDCIYCSLPKTEWNACAHGFPGCARADDAMLCPHIGAEFETQETLSRLHALADQMAEALRPLASVAGLVDVETKGIGETDEFQLLFADYLMASWQLSTFREARAAIEAYERGK